MSAYTPTTEDYLYDCHRHRKGGLIEDTEQERTTTEVLIAYRMSELGYHDMPDDAPHDPEELAEVDAEFHNWLDEVRAEAWHEGYGYGRDDQAKETRTGQMHVTLNPYRQEKDA